MPLPPRSHSQRILRWVFAVIAGLAGLVVALLLVAHTPAARRAAANQVATLLAGRQISLQADELRYNLFSLSFDLRNVRLSAAAPADLPAFATIQRARIDLSLPDLLRRRYVVQSGSAEGVTVHYVVRPDGVDNLPRLPSDPNQPQNSIDYLIADFRIPSAHVRYEDQRQPIDIVLPQASVEITGSRLTDRHEVKLDVGAGQATLQDRTTAIEGIRGVLSIGDEDVRLDNLELRALAARLAIDGTIGPFDNPAADLSVRGNVDIAHAAAFANTSQAVGGRLELTATVKGPMAEPVIDARVHGSGLSLQDLSGAELDLVAAYDLKTRHARIPSFRVDAPWGATAGEGELSMGSQRSHLRASIKALDLGTLSKTWQASVTPATRVDGTVQAEWPGLDYLTASGDADLRLMPTRAQASPSVMPIAGRAAIRARDGRFAVDIKQFKAMGADVTGRIAMSEGRELDGQLSAEVANIGTLASSLEAFLNRSPGSLMPANSAGLLTLDATVGGTVSAPEIGATAGAPALTIGGASGVALSAQASIDATRLTIESADLNWQQARAHLTGSVGLAGARRLDLILNATGVDLLPVVQAFDVRDIPVMGMLAAQATIGGTMARPVVRGSVQGRELAAYDEPLGSLTAELNLAGAELVLSQFEIDKPQPTGNGQITGRGSYHLDRGSYSVDLRSQNVRLQQLLLPGGERLRGKVELAATGAGTLESPSGKLSLTIESLEVDTPPPTQSAASSSYLPATLALGRIVLEGVAAGKQATITAAADQFKLDLRARVGLQRPWPTTLDLQARDLDLAALPLELSSPLDGSLRMTLNASGDLVQPSRGSATVDVESLAGSWGGQPFSITSPARVRYADEQLVVDRLELAARDAALRLTGSLPLTERAVPGRITVDARAQLAALVQYLPADTNITGDGVMTLSGSIAGTLRAIDPNLLIVVEDGLFLTPQLEPGLSNLTLRLRVAEGEAQIEQLGANWGSAAVEASGRIPFDALPQLPVDVPRKSGASTFKATIRGLNPAAIPGAPRGLGGQIALDAQLSAARAELAAVEGRLTFPELALTFDKLGLQQQKATSITLASGSATLEDVDLAGSVGSLTATGTISLVGERPVAVDVEGTINAGAVSALTDAVQAEGSGTVQLAARGTIAAPELNGFVALADVTAVSDEPNIAAEHVNARIDLRGGQVTLTQLTADVNGGTFEAGGSATLGRGGLEAIDLQATTRDFAFDAPLDLRSLSDATLNVRSNGDEIVVGGQVTIDEAGLTGDFNFDQGLLAAMTARPELNLTRERNALLERVRFDVNVDTATPVIVDNNVARAEVAVDVRVVGSPYQPGLIGRVELLEGGEITLNERRFEAERAVITFVDERRIQPSVDLLLKTSAGSYDIDVAVSGTPGETETTLTSDPSLPEPDIMAMLVTGRTLDEMRGEEFEVAQEQVLSYLTGRVGSQLGRGLERATGLSEVRIEPNLIANEADPSARLTIGQELTDELKFVYSTSLTDSNDQILLAEYDITRRFQTRGVRQSDNSFRFDFSHDLRFGGVPAPRRLERIRPRVKAVTISGDAGDESQLQDLLEIEPGDPYDFFTIRRGLQRIEERLIEQGHLQSRVRLERQVQSGVGNSRCSSQARSVGGDAVRRRCTASRSSRVRSSAMASRRLRQAAR